MFGTEEASDHPVEGSVTSQLNVDLVACIISVRGDEPVVLTTRRSDGDVELPSQAYLPGRYPELEHGLIDRIHELTGIRIEHLDQLFTLGERGTSGEDRSIGAIAIGYLGLLGPGATVDTAQSQWRSCFDFLPWEDRRQDLVRDMAEFMRLRLEDAASAGGSSELTDRARRLFGLGGALWDDERSGERFDLLCELGLLADRHPNQAAGSQVGLSAGRGPAMIFDHRRILATALGRLRARIRQRPMAVELMPTDFTLFELQRTVEAILGPGLHKQNFRRLVEGSGLVEATGDVRMRTGGRPAKLFRFRREALLERTAFGATMRSGDPVARA